MNNFEVTNTIETTTQKSQISQPLPPLPPPGQPWIIPIGYDGPIPPGIQVIREGVPPGFPDFLPEELETGTSSTDSLIGSANVGTAEDVLRFWNFTSLSHIFTANQTEIDDLTGQPNFFRREGNEFDVPVNEGEAVYRYRNSATGTDLLTFDSLVADFLPQYRSLGVAFNAYTEDNRPDNAIPIYRLKNLNAEAVNPLNITHFFTSDPFNRQLVLDTLPFGDEGIGFWALPSFTDGLPA